MELTKQKDTDFIILLDLPDVDFFKICSKFNTEDSLELKNKYFNRFCKNETLWKERLFKYYGIFYPEEGQTWKNLYLKLVYYMDKYKYNKNSRNSFTKASIKGHLEAVKLMQTTRHHYGRDLEYAIEKAVENGHSEVVRFLSS